MSECLFGNGEGNPYPRFREAADREWEDEERAALLTLVTHAEHDDDLRHFQSVRDALECLRDELMCGVDLPESSFEGIARLIGDEAQPPEIARADVPVPSPMPVPDTREFAEEVLDLSVCRRPTSS